MLCANFFAEKLVFSCFTKLLSKRSVQLLLLLWRINFTYKAYATAKRIKVNDFDQDTDIHTENNYLIV